MFGASAIRLNIGCALSYNMCEVETFLIELIKMCVETLFPGETESKCATGETENECEGTKHQMNDSQEEESVYDQEGSIWLNQF